MVLDLLREHSRFHAHVVLVETLVERFSAIRLRGSLARSQQRLAEGHQSIGCTTKGTPNFDGTAQPLLELVTRHVHGASVPGSDTT